MVRLRTSLLDAPCEEGFEPGVGKEPGGDLVVERRTETGCGRFLDVGVFLVAEGVGHGREMGRRRRDQGF